MTHQIARTITACLIASFAASGGSSRAADRPSPSSGLHRAARIDILVDGRVRPQYVARGTRYVEALKGADYQIRVTNPYPVRVAVALSVDGLNTIDARHTTAAEARKWVLDPHETVTLSGWQVSAAHARRFHFTTEARSYGQALGRTADLGVISAVFYRERARPEVTINALPWPVSSSRAPEAAPPADANAARAAAADEFAATGLGSRTRHDVRQVSIDLEDAPAASVSLRYEFRTQLVRLGVLPPAGPGDPLDRRERARGFEPGFCPEPKR